MGWLGLGLGEFGAQLGEGRIIRQEMQDREARLALDRARQQMEEMMLPYQMAKLKAETDRLTMGQTLMMTGPAQSTWAVDVGPTGTPLRPPREIIAGKPDLKTHIEDLYLKGDAESIAEAKRLEPQLAEVTAATAKLSPTNEILKEISDAFDARDPERMRRAQEKLASIQKPPAHLTMTDYIQKCVNEGDQKSCAVMKASWDQQEKIARERAQFRLFNPDNYEVNGEILVMNGFQALDLAKAGNRVRKVGAFPIQTLIAAQQVASEAGPAYNMITGTLKEVMDPTTGKMTLMDDAQIAQFAEMGRKVQPTGRMSVPLKSYDNLLDQAIFLKVLKDPRYQRTPGLEVEYLNSVLDAVGSANLSPEGQALIIGLRRYAETMGRLRSLLGLQATDNAMALTLSLLPNPETATNSTVALQRMISLNNMIKLAVQIPALADTVPGLNGPVTAPTPNAPYIMPGATDIPAPAASPFVPGPPAGNQPPPGAPRTTLDDFLKEPH